MFAAAIHAVDMYPFQVAETRLEIGKGYLDGVVQNEEGMASCSLWTRPIFFVWESNPFLLYHYLWRAGKQSTWVIRM